VFHTLWEFEEGYHVQVSVVRHLRFKVSATKLRFSISGSRGGVGVALIAQALDHGQAKRVLKSVSWAATLKSG
jgi:hypothetical protein